ncbi:MAG: anthranilate/aminodeoxychorismate synthase component II [Alphaproteobacteria bacterium RIFCSPLOWO2_01_FULL_40_26]|nr:MAG: anthranilate/aminodeoxychorismate synthase component II [Alphaproteobacteria bacterium RIFCSPHIGHO2_02_FULL_40_34]OFW88461.1 MAG: anthranilate/aminodeoxychorismate synthase component II [Alphaproteobacteria bacterium RIFCSPHIGHO2_01_FULL_40_8]OFW94837.1 MAG: anthranilate/aminodeoxychorismate synthase component II [Alphaproteobacteria bacterium RIFCSPLOWO2_01_FULL_40_26]OFX10463.1 MAG: anthranilate/aminodeoxychorismate synthase component II [Alphaproteobacteria bacterium RIFCSPLOWO2_02_FU
MILLIDNYDSFTYNLYHYLIQAGEKQVVVKRNDEISVAEIKKMKPRGIVLSPGPCTPNDAGICLEIIKKLQGIFPIFGVCLGHQAIGQAFGGKVVKTYPMHGKVSEIFHQGKNIFKGLPSPFKAARYHSLIIEKKTCPKNLQITAETKEGIIMGIADEKLKIFGVQFHPESIASEHGHTIIKNFLKII